MDKIAAMPIGAATKAGKKIKRLIEIQNAGSRASLSSTGKSVKSKIVAQNKTSKTALNKRLSN